MIQNQIKSMILMKMKNHKVMKKKQIKQIKTKMINIMIMMKKLIEEMLLLDYHWNINQKMKLLKNPLKN